MAASPLKRSRVVRRRGLSGSAVPVRTVLYDFVHTVRGRGGPPGSVGERESTVHTARYGHAPEERRIFIPRGFRPVPNSRPPDSAEEKGKISDRTRTRTGWWERGKKGKKARHPADPSPPRCSCQIRQLKTTSRDCFHSTERAWPLCCCGSCPMEKKTTLCSPIRTLAGPRNN